MTIGGLEWAGDKLREVTRKHGKLAGGSLALVGALATLPWLYGAGSIDMAVTIWELAIGDPRHRSNEDYDRMVKEISAIRKRLEAAGK